jgi:hypothetical protein
MSDEFLAALTRIQARMAGDEAERRALPCFLALEAGDHDGAVDACEAARAYDTCRWSRLRDACPRARAIDTYEAIAQHLTHPMLSARVPKRETELLLAAARWKARVPLRALDSLRIVRAVLRRRRERVTVENGAEVRKGAERIPGAVYLTGSEAIVVFAGNQGRGKTTAACYAIARVGGMYTRAPQWTRRNGVDIDEAIRVPALVVDQFGREHFGDSDWARSQFEDTVDARYQAERLTLLVGNVQYEGFCERLKGTTVVDRVHGDGVFVELGGESIRADLRTAALESQSEENLHGLVSEASTR